VENWKTIRIGTREEGQMRRQNNRRRKRRRKRRRNKGI
jgi:hypothetical protein